MPSQWAVQTFSVLDSIFQKSHWIIKFLSACGKGPKKTFAPPAPKLHSLMCYSPKPPKEDTVGISSPKARLEKKEEKATTENGPSSGQENKGKPQDKQVEKKEKVSVSLMGSSGTVSPRYPDTLLCRGTCSFLFLSWGFYFLLKEVE